MKQAMKQLSVVGHPGPAPAPAPAPEQVEWIQALRGIACVLVVLTHARYFFLNTSGWPLADQLLQPGAAGVDLFFVISGFIMAHTTWNAGRSDAGKFLARRLTRIWPPYAVMTLLWALAIGGGLSGLIHGGWRPLLRSLFFIPVDPAAPPFFTMVLPVGWTLVFEFYFYLSFAFALLFGRWRWLVLVAWIGLTAVLLPASVQEWTGDVQQFRGFGRLYAPVASNPFMLEFLYGVAAAWVYRSPLRIASERMCWNLLLLVAPAALWACYTHFLPFHGPLAWGLAAGAIVTAMALAGKTIRLNFPPALLWLGTISYSLYLTHTFTQHFLVHWGEKNHVNTHTWDFVWVTTCICFVVAYVYFELVETRLTSLLRRARS
jgi:peptidoglycan/LPS O-acetylase OafA/YrhL